MLQSRNEVAVNNDADNTQAGLSALRCLASNCYEAVEAHSLSVQTGHIAADYLGVGADLRMSLDSGFGATADRPNTLRTLGQIYFAHTKYGGGLRYLNQWIASGAAPARDAKWTLASIYLLQDQYSGALPWPSSF